LFFFNTFNYFFTRKSLPEIRVKRKISTSLKRKRNIGNNDPLKDIYKGRGNGKKATRKDLIQEITDYKGGVTSIKSIKSKKRDKLADILNEKKSLGLQKFSLVIPEITFPGIYNQNNLIDF